MAVTWDVVSLDSTKTVGSLSDVITKVHWQASDKDGEHVGYRYGCIDLADANSKSFTTYKDVTKNDAIAWAKAALGSDEVTAIETDIAAQITESKTPTKTRSVPW
jgi:hypothetical protein|tara:strand:- start:47 stop:361 length:315 start_codon:yes stop_codon:yes gene_type:complete